MRNAFYCDCLRKARIFLAINNSFGLYLPQDGVYGSWLETLIGRWSVKTHTFVLEWGEMTPTLEDVVALTGLELYGDLAFVQDMELTAEQ